MIISLRLDDQSPVPGRAGFLFYYHVQTDNGAYLASYQMHTRVLTSGVKRLEHEDDLKC